MARETRIGLVVGMGFIICFAVILSHRGQPPASATQQSYDVTGPGREVQPLVNTQLAEQRARRLGQGRQPAAQNPTQVDQQQQSPRLAMGGSSARNDAPVEDFVLPRRSPLDVDNNNPGRSATATAASPDRFTARGEPIEVATPPVATPAPEQPVIVTMTQPDPMPAADQNGAQPLVLRMPPRLDNPAPAPEPVSEAVANMPVALSDASAGRAERSEILREPPRQQEAPRIERTAVETGLVESQAMPEPVEQEEYTVQPGDTLSRIAKARYGTCAPDVLDAIYEANRGAMKSPDHIVVGKTIVLPMLEGEKAGADPVPVQEPKSAPTPITPLRKIKPAYAHVYEIQPGDSLSKIASRHYGSAAPHVLDAICEANADVITSRDVVVVGRKINLPELDGLAGSDAVESEPLPQQGHAVVAAADERFDEPDADETSDGAGREGTGWRWYQLQKGDVYSRVAARQLGSSKRWKELAEMNKDIFPDPGRIRQGVLIRVPIDDGSASIGEDYGQRG